MTNLLESWVWWVEAVAVGLALLVVDPLARRIITAARIGHRRKARLRRLLPLVEIGAWTVLLVWVVQRLFENHPTASLIPLAIISAVLLLGSWFAIRDMIGGAILRTEEVYEPGEWMRVGNTEGRIRHVGVRSIELEMDDGKRLRVPYSGIAGSPITKAEPTGSATAHSFQVVVPRALSVSEVKTRLQKTAQLSMWASTTRRPQVELTRHTPDTLTFGLTVYALHPDYDLEVENAVRAVVDEMQAGYRTNEISTVPPTKAPQ
jgi:small conductance mechanosensitive channel